MTDKNNRESVQGAETSLPISKEELLQEVVQMVSQQMSQHMNSIITQRNSAFEKKIESLLSAKVVPQQVDSSAEDLETRKSSKAGKDRDPEFLALKKQVEEMKAKEADAIAKQKDFSLREQLKEQLTKAGVAPHLMKAAIATLISEDKAVGYSSNELDDRIVFRSKSGEEDLTSGLRTWIRSDEGKAFVAPKGVQGSGDKNYSAGKKVNSGVASDNDLATLLVNLRNG